MSVLECSRCAGLWISGPVFETLEEKARERQLQWKQEAGDAPPPARDNQAEPMYRPCPECKKLMNRRNYGRRSGVIVDICSEHGVWFDLGELSRILSWVRDGGLAQAQEKERLQARTEARRDMDAYWRNSQPPLGRQTRGLDVLLSKVLNTLFG